MTVYQLAIVTAADPAVSEIIHILDRVRKHAAKSALIGLGLALLAPVVVAIMKQILGA